MSENKEPHTEPGTEHINNFSDRIEVHFMKHKKIYTGVAAALLLIIAGFFAYRYLYQAPRNRQADDEIIYAQNYFEMDSLQVALDGNALHTGFLDIISAYSGTHAANLSRYYAGMSYLKLGQFEDAITHLKKFKTKDLILAPLTSSAIGDCYAELGDMNSALNYYEKACNQNPNELLTPKILMKTAAAYEIAGRYKDALKCYMRIQSDFIRSDEARDIEKYIAMTEARIQ